MADHFKKLENYKEGTPKSIMKSDWQSKGLFEKEVRKAHIKGSEVGQIHAGKIGDKKLPDPNKASHSTRL